MGSLKLLIGLLLINGLLKKQIVVFSDGARNIHNAVQKMLGFANCKIILDWYHLKKKRPVQIGNSPLLQSRRLRSEFKPGETHKIFLELKWECRAEI
jgi:hypothetical protein